MNCFAILFVVRLEFLKNNCSFDYNYARQYRWWHTTRYYEFLEWVIRMTKIDLSQQCFRLEDLKKTDLIFSNKREDSINIKLNTVFALYLVLQLETVTHSNYSNHLTGIAHVFIRLTSCFASWWIRTSNSQLG